MNEIWVQPSRWIRPRYFRLGAILVGLSWSFGVWAQTGTEVSLTVTGQRQVDAYTGVENAVHVVLAVTPGSTSAAATSNEATASDERNNAFTFVQADGESVATSGSDVPPDALESDEFTEPGAPSGSRRGRGEETQAEASNTTPFVLSPSFTRKVLEAAIAAQGVTTALSRLEGLGTRARTSALLPEVRFRAGRDVDQTLRLAPTEEDPYRYTQTGGVSYIIEGQATFRLSRLLFASEELGIERLRLAQTRERQRVTALVLEELVAWERAWRGAQSTEPSAQRARTKLHEAALRLDVLTEGWFSEHEPQLSVQGLGASRLPGVRPEPSSRPTAGENRGKSPKNHAERRAPSAELERLATSR